VHKLLNLKRKKMKKQNKGFKFEKQVQRSIGSGRLWFSPLDIDTDDYCIECKYTDKKGYRISTDLLEKAWGQALDMGKEPMLIIGIKRNDNQIFSLHCKINVERKEH